MLAVVLIFIALITKYRKDLPKGDKLLITQIFAEAKIYAQVVEQVYTAA